VEDAVVRTEPGISRLVSRLFGSSLGLKYLMAVTGLAMVGFVVSHMAGNLLVYAGPDAINGYALGLRKLGALLWLARGGLLLAAVLHIWAAWQLTVRNRQARPVPYQMQATVQASFASRTMRWTGVIVLAFLVYHLAHYTLLVANPEYATFRTPEGHQDVYRMVVTGFSNPVISLFYIFANVLLGMHLSHGIASMFQSMGWLSDQYRPLVSTLARGLAWGLIAGFVAVPLGVLTGVVR